MSLPPAVSNPNKRTRPGEMRRAHTSGPGRWAGTI